MLAPPLLVSYTSPENFLSALPEELLDEHRPKIIDLISQGLPPVVSSRCLAVLFGYSTKFVNAMAANSHNYYREFSIRTGRKRRQIQSPKVALKVIQKWFGHHLAQALPVEDYVFGFVKGRSTLDAASKHCGSDWVYSVDIKNFFPSTHKSRVVSQLTQLGYSPKAANLLGNLCCYKDALAQGAPSSPVLSNLVMHPTDVKIKAIADKLGLTFTRYADDIVFSGTGEFPHNLKKLISSVFEDTCWNLSQQKEYLAEAEKGQRLKVHGLLVGGDVPKLTKGYRNKIRAYRHLLKTENIKPNDMLRVVGHIKYAESVESWPVSKAVTNKKSKTTSGHRQNFFQTYS